MAPRKQPTPEDRHDAVVVALTGLASGQDLDSVIEKLGALHVPRNTFPAEELLELASDAIGESGTTAADPSSSRRSGSVTSPSTDSPEGTSTTRASTPSPLPP